LEVLTAEAHSQRKFMDQNKTKHLQHGGGIKDVIQDVLINGTIEDDEFLQMREGANAAGASDGRSNDPRYKLRRLVQDKMLAGRVREKLLLKPTKTRSTTHLSTRRGGHSLRWRWLNSMDEMCTARNGPGCLDRMQSTAATRVDSGEVESCSS
jgi:hypothetical protein